MSPAEYQKNVLKTESSDFPAIQGRLFPQSGEVALARLLHASLGLQTESAEVADLIKKGIFYGKPVDSNKVIDELGDIMWYLALAADAMGHSLEHIMITNIAKLRERYKDGRFDADLAINKDTAREMEVQKGIK